MKWIELSVCAHQEAVDAIASVFLEHGTGGVVIEQEVRSHIEGEEPPVFEGLPIIRAYLPLNEAEPELEQHLEQALWHLQAFNLSPIGSVARREVDEDDWAEAWKVHFHPLVIGRVVIKPTWREWDATDDQIVVELDPGMAFGTGLHPTTSLMIKALQEYVAPDMRILDLGTGSGVLAIAAAHLGADVTAIDISDVAIEVATANVRANGVADRVILATGTIAQIRGQRYDLIFANIIASVLVDLAHDLHDALLSGGSVLASGIIDERVDSVRNAFAQAGLSVDAERYDQDWWLLIAGRPA